MTELLLDTSILIPFTRATNQVADRVDADYQVTSSGFRPTICVVSLGEMRAFARAWGEARIERMESVLETFPVVDISREEVLTAYAELHHANKAGGCGIGQNDLWIAAAANAIEAAVLTSDHDLLRLPDGTVRVIQVNANTGVTENYPT